jgi:hypothetical protein
MLLRRAVEEHPEIERAPGNLRGLFKDGAYAFAGSTTVAYGDFERNGDADLLCQFFIEGVLRGASVGRAFLEARHRFVKKASRLDPAERKTLAQFNVYGDPSLTPVSLQGVPSLMNASSTADVLSARTERKERRRLLFQQGSALLIREPLFRRSPAKPVSRVHRALQAKARELNLRPTSAMSFELRDRPLPEALPTEFARKPTFPSAFHVLFCRSERGRRNSKTTPSGVRDIVVLIAIEVDGAMKSYRKTHSH